VEVVSRVNTLRLILQQYSAAAAAAVSAVVSAFIIVCVFVCVHCGRRYHRGSSSSSSSSNTVNLPTVVWKRLQELITKKERSKRKPKNGFCTPKRRRQKYLIEDKTYCNIRFYFLFPPNHPCHREPR
jgi:cell division protein FtsN